MSSNLKILDASLKDSSVLGFIQSQTWLNSYVNQELGITKEDIQTKVDQWNQDGTDRIKAEMNKPGAHTWIAKDDRKVVGFVAVLKGFEANTIEALHVLPEYQGQGIGTQLFKTALEWLGNEKKITMEVVVYNLRAQELYRKFGFNVVGVSVEDPIVMPSGKCIPKVIMICG